MFCWTVLCFVGLSVMFCWTECYVLLDLVFRFVGLSVCYVGLSIVLLD
jgi:hypothetical protein